MGFGGIGPGIGNGMTAESAVRWVARNVEHAGDLMRTMLVGQAVSQSTAIYAMVISLVLIFVKKKTNLFLEEVKWQLKVQIS